MDVVNLSACNTASFVFSRIMSNWADVLPLASGKFRAHMRLAVNDPVVWYEWSSDNRRAAYTETRANGSFVFSGQPSPGDTLLLGASAVTFLAAGPTIIVEPRATVTMTIAAPAIISWAAHGLPIGSPVKFTTTGSMATGVPASTIFYISSAGYGANSFQIADTQAHALAGTNSIASSGSQSGTITGYAPSTIVLAAHGLAANTPVVLYSTGNLPGGFSSGPIYYVLASLLTTNTFQLAATPGGTPLITMPPFAQAVPERKSDQ